MVMNVGKFIEAGTSLYLLLFVGMLELSSDQFYLFAAQLRA